MTLVTGPARDGSGEVVQAPSRDGDVAGLPTGAELVNVGLQPRIGADTRLQPNDQVVHAETRSLIQRPRDRRIAS